MHVATDARTVQQRLFPYKKSAHLGLRVICENTRINGGTSYVGIPTTLLGTRAASCESRIPIYSFLKFFPLSCTEDYASTLARTAGGVSYRRTDSYEHVTNNIAWREWVT